MSIKNIYLLKSIETPRLKMRFVRQDDIVPINKAINNSLEVLRKWQPWARDSSLEATTKFVNDALSIIRLRGTGDFPLSIIHKEDDKIIGVISYNDRSNPKGGEYEVGYWCDINYQGNGYITESVNALSRYAFAVLKAENVFVRMERSNLKSMNVPKRLHFKKTGTRSSVSKKGSEDYLFSCSTIKQLPTLDVKWDIEE